MISNVANNDSMHKEVLGLLAKGLDLEVERQESSYGTWTLAVKIQVAACLARTLSLWCSRRRKSLTLQNDVLWELKMLEKKRRTAIWNSFIRV